MKNEKKVEEEQDEKKELKLQGVWGKLWDKYPTTAGISAAILVSVLLGILGDKVISSICKRSEKIMEEVKINNPVLDISSSENFRLFEFNNGQLEPIIETQFLVPVADSTIKEPYAVVKMSSALDMAPISPFMAPSGRPFIELHIPPGGKVETFSPPHYGGPHMYDWKLNPDGSKNKSHKTPWEKQSWREEMDKKDQQARAALAFNRANLPRHNPCPVRGRA